MTLWMRVLAQSGRKAQIHRAGHLPSGPVRSGLPTGNHRPGPFGEVHRNQFEVIGGIGVSQGHQRSDRFNRQGVAMTDGTTSGEHEQEGTDSEAPPHASSEDGEVRFFDWLVNLDPRALGTLSLVLYASGFLVTNLHHAAFGPGDPELLDGSYVLTSLVFAAFTVPFIVAGWLYSTTLICWWENGWEDLFSWGVLASGAWILAALVTAGGLAIGGATGIRSAGPEFLVYAFTVTVVSVVIYSISVGHPRQLGYVLALCLVPFSFTLHPQISPAIGGGAGWEIQRVFEGEDPTTTELLVRQSGAVMTTLRCGPPDGERLVTETSVLSEEQRIRVLGARSVASFRLSCPTEPNATALPAADLAVGRRAAEE